MEWYDAPGAQWNPRYLAYCIAHGETDPKVMLARDKEAYPGGSMVGFSLWIQEQWKLWIEEQKAEFPQLAGGSAHEWDLYKVTHAAVFDAWLQKRAGGGQ